MHITVYVYDILIEETGEAIREIIAYLRKEYELKDLGEVSNYLGNHMHKTEEYFFLYQ